jgi:GT2 family glycosyltransferase
VLANLHRQDLPEGARLTHVVVDDGSTDGTTTSIRMLFPDVEIVPGSGRLFWAGGMRHGWEQSVRCKAFDYLFVYNDDVRLERWAIADLLRAGRTLASQGHDCHAVVGSFRAAATGRTTYGGWRRSSPWHPLKFSSRLEPDGTLQPADVFNMNGALISRTALEKAGFLSHYFVHSGADFEFALRLVKLGGVIRVAERHIGLCDLNPASELSPDGLMPLRQRLSLLFDPKREPVQQRLCYYREHAGPFWLFMFLSPYVTVWLRHLLSSFGSVYRTVRIGKAAEHGRR